MITNFNSQIEKFISPKTFFIIKPEIAQSCGGSLNLSKFISWRYSFLLRYYVSKFCNRTDVLTFRDEKINIFNFIDFIARSIFVFNQFSTDNFVCGVYPPLKYRGFLAIEILFYLEVGSPTSKPIPICAFVLNKIKQELNKEVLSKVGVRIDN